MNVKTGFNVLVMLMLLLAVVLSVRPALAGERPIVSWVMFQALQDSGGDVDLFDERISFLADSNPLMMLPRAAAGDKIRSANIGTVGQGRDYRKNLFYKTREETIFTGRLKSVSCTMTVYYDPKTRRIDSVLCTGDCANDTPPEVPGVKFLHMAQTTGNPK